MDTNNRPVTGVKELEKHLGELIADPTLEPNAKLFDDVELQLTESNIHAFITRLLPNIIKILKHIQHDPAKLCSLAIKLLGPLTFVQAVSLASEDSIIQALRSPAPSANILAMTLLGKAANSAADAAVLAAMKNVITNFLTQWLSAPQVEVGEKGSKVLGDLLEADCETRPPDTMAVNGKEIILRRRPGQGFVWRRLFHDRDIYSLLLSLCSAGAHQNADDGLSEHQLSLAQGRLLRILPRLAALNFAAVTRSDYSELNQRYGHFNGNGGILQFAALHMIDREDPLMHLSLIDFFETLLSIQRITPFSTYKMDTLKVITREATSNDLRLQAAITTLPERTAPKEADELKRFIMEVLSS
ncbi:hypothetical protein F5Y15DRAFT_415267 [Xylariaceae sp. FL0016]|nr:hypothetical protein F5Y15DRAFT_415267 [Xylariaceae sp. FL0016]